MLPGSSRLPADSRCRWVRAEGARLQGRILNVRKQWRRRALAAHQPDSLPNRIGGKAGFE